MKFDVYNVLTPDGFRYAIILVGIITAPLDVILWCQSQFGVDAFSRKLNRIYFKTAADREWFILRWS
jgi:hypothetical protein